MPSVIIGQPFASGAQIVVSGLYWSGRTAPDTAYTQNYPQGGVYLSLDRSSSGSVYIGLSGGMTFNSGGAQLAGGAFSGMLDGVQLIPGGNRFIPRICCGLSGQLGIWAWADPACSGQARLYFEIQ